MKVTAKILINKVSENKFPFLSKLGIADVGIKEISLDLYPDFNKTPYQGTSAAHYVLSQPVSIEGYVILFSANLKDYGYKVEGFEDEEELVKEKDDMGNGAISLELSDLDLRNATLTLSGSIYGDSFDICDNYCNAVGVTKSTYKKLDLFKQLLLEGQLLELEKNFRLATFTYFSAVDQYINSKLEDYKPLIYPEMHDSLVRLSLKDKLRIIVKEALGVVDFSHLPIWTEFVELFSEMVDVRNTVAHGVDSAKLQKDYADKAFFLAVCLYSIINLKLTDSISLNRHFLKKTKS